MKTIKVGAWYEKLTQKEKAYFSAKVERFGVQVLRSYFTTARKQFDSQSDYEFGNSLTLTHNGIEYYYSLDRKEFCPFSNEVKK